MFYIDAILEYCDRPILNREVEGGTKYILYILIKKTKY